MQRNQLHCIARVFMIIAMFWLFFTHSLFAAKEEIELDHFRELLEKGLSLYELEQELLRLEDKQNELNISIMQMENRSRHHEEEWEKLKSQTGELLRAYYMGERDQWITVLFGLNSWSDIWTVFEHIKIIFERDQALFDQAFQAWRDLNRELNELKWAADELSAIEQRLILERERVIVLEHDINHSLDQEVNKELAQTQIELIRADWEKVGKPLLISYFHALESAMKELPQLIEQDEQNKLLRQEGLQFVFTLEDSALNEFLVEQDDLFQDLTFLFEDNRMIAEGSHQDSRIWLSGQYIVRNEPENHLAFELNGMRYQGLSLPQTTIDAFNEEFLLGFYPNQLLPFIRVKDVKMEFGKLEVFLTFQS